MDFKAINMICPKCGNSNYMRRMVGDNVGELNVKCTNCNSYFNYEELISGKEEPLSKENPSLVAVDLWFSDGTADTLTKIQTYDITSNDCDDNCINLSIKNAHLQPFIKYQDQSEVVFNKLRNVNSCLKTLCFMLDQYSLPKEENHVTEFSTTQDLAKYFKIMADLCLKASEFE